jgi:hypothetical protein
MKIIWEGQIEDLPPFDIAHVRVIRNGDDLYAVEWDAEKNAWVLLDHEDLYAQALWEALHALT